MKTYDNTIFDSYNRIARKLRISVTDKCNFRCNFCMPDDPVWLQNNELLTFNEITRLAKIMSNFGINKIRLSGGEPLLRKNIDHLVKDLVNIKKIKSVNITTNGILLKQLAAPLKKAGLNGVTISLHSLKNDRFDKIVGVKNTLNQVLEGIQYAQNVNLSPIKINCVIIKGCNEDEILDFAKFAYDNQIVIRFIEFMPFDGNKFWGMDQIIGKKQILKTIRKKYDLIASEREFGSTAHVYNFKDNPNGGIGVISSMTEPFCSDCDRIRLKADGNLVPCLFSQDEYNLRPFLRNGCSDIEISKIIKKFYLKKFSGIETLIKEKINVDHIRPMHTIGG